MTSTVKHPFMTAKGPAAVGCGDPELRNAVNRGFAVSKTQTLSPGGLVYRLVRFRQIDTTSLGFRWGNGDQSAEQLAKHSPGGSIGAVHMTAMHGSSLAHLTDGLSWSRTCMQWKATAANGR